MATFMVASPLAMDCFSSAASPHLLIRGNLQDADRAWFAPNSRDTNRLPQAAPRPALCRMTITGVEAGRRAQNVLLVRESRAGFLNQERPSTSAAAATWDGFPHFQRLLLLLLVFVFL